MKTEAVEDTLRNIEILLDRAQVADVMEPRDLYRALQSQCRDLLAAHERGELPLDSKLLATANELLHRIDKNILEVPQLKISRK